MKCGDIMNKRAEWLMETDTVLDAAERMRDAGIGFLPICDAKRRVIGVVTDRDLVTRSLARNVEAATTSAGLVMSAPALTCIESADVHDAEDLMAAERKARLVITDADGRLTGVLDLADLVERAPRRESLATVRAVLWREALGPRGGAGRGQPLLKDDPTARAQPAPSDDLSVRPSVFAGGHHFATGTREFPV